MSLGGYSRLPPEPLVPVALTRGELHTLARALEREADTARAERQDHLAERLDNRGRSEGGRPMTGMRSSGDIAAVASQRARLADGGWRPVPVFNCDARCNTPGKQPKGEKWQLLARRDPPHAATARPERDALNTGLLCDGLRAIDIDVDDRDIAATIRAQAVAAFGETIVRSRSNTGRCLLVYRATEGSPPKRVLSGARGKVEILGHGQQFVSHGQHPSGVPLQWFPSGPDTTPADAVPAVAEPAIADPRARRRDPIPAGHVAELVRLPTAVVAAGSSLDGETQMPADDLTQKDARALTAAEFAAAKRAMTEAERRASDRRSDARDLAAVQRRHPDIAAKHAKKEG